MIRVSVVKGEDRRRNVAQALNLIRQDIDPNRIEGKAVFIKPNLVSSSVLLAVTHVDAVRAVVEFVQDFNPERITIAEGSGDTRKAFRNFGYDELQGDYDNVELIDVNADRYGEIGLLTMTGEEHTVRLSRAAIDSDFIFSVARAKTHDHVTCTLSLKNMQGCLLKGDQVWPHGAAREPDRDVVRSNCLLSRNLVTIVKAIKPDVGVIDGTVAMEGDGPGGGSPVDLGVVVASSDFVAADAVMAEIMGFEAMEIGYIYYTDKVGLGTGRLEGIEVLGERIEDVRMKFKPHSNYYETQAGWRRYAHDIMGSHTQHK